MKNTLRVLVAAFCYLFLFSCSSGSNPSEETSKNHPHKKEVSTDCSNCGMPSEDYPKWRVKAYFGEGLSYFCSPKCFFLHQSKQELADSAFVMDFYEVKSTPAKKAFYIIGSDVLGPMGKDLVPVATQEAAQEFAKDHHGQAPKTFEEALETIKANGL